MNIDIRKSIINNFKDNSDVQIIEAINESINDKDEITLPGLGVFFELLWINSNNNSRENIIHAIKKGF